MIIVGICGASGSGKSTLAKRIRDSLSCNCLIIGQDCYYHNFSYLPFEERVHLNYDEPSIFDYDELLHDLDELQAGRSVTKKGYDYSHHLRADTDELIYEYDVEGDSLYLTDPAVEDAEPIEFTRESGENTAEAKASAVNYAE